MNNKQKRAVRLAEAKQKGDHTTQEWDDMLFYFHEICARCLGKSGNYNIEKDHIIPIYQGGSNSIQNIQPLCAFCNSSKGPETTDWRPQLAEFIHHELPDNYTNPF